MSNNNKYKINFDLNKFLDNIKFKKKYVKDLKAKISSLAVIRKTNYKLVNAELFPAEIKLYKDDNLITYVIDINFSRSNTFVQVMDFAGKLKLFYSSGSFNYSGKSKKVRYTVFRDFYRVLVSKLKFFKGKPVALHLKNVGYNKFWIVKKLKKSFFIKSVKSFVSYSHNGCRKRKMRRKKFKK